MALKYVNGIPVSPTAPPSDAGISEFSEYERDLREYERAMASLSPELQSIQQQVTAAGQPGLLSQVVAQLDTIPDEIKNAKGSPQDIANALINYRTTRPVANNDAFFVALQNTPAYQSLPQAEKERFSNEISNWYARNQTSGGGFGLPSFSLNPLKQAKNVVKNDQKNVGAVVEALEPLTTKAIKNNPATVVTGLDKQLADKLGWNWLQHRTNKTDQSIERTSNKAGAFNELFSKGTAEGMQGDSFYSPSDANRTRLEADRAHVRTNNPETIRAGIERGEYRRLPNGDVVDRYGNSVLGQGLAQRTTTALQVASMIMPVLAPLAAAASTATAYRHGAPAGKAIGQGIGSYYAGELGGQFGAQFGKAGAAAGASTGRSLASGYAQGLRGGDLLEAALYSGLAGGAGAGAGLSFDNPYASRLASSTAAGAVRGLQKGDILEGATQGAIGGALGGVGAATNTGALASQLYQTMQRNRKVKEQLAARRALTSNRQV